MARNLLIALCLLASLAEARNPRGAAIVTSSPTVIFTFVPPTTNTDSSAVTAGEITSYQIGIRPSGTGSPGTYSIFVSVPLTNAGAILSTSIQPPLASGTYYAAIRTVGSTDSAWSSEQTFTQ